MVELNTVAAVTALIQAVFAVYLVWIRPFREARLFAGALLIGALASGSNILLFWAVPGSLLFKVATLILFFSLGLVVPVSLHAAFTFLQRIGISTWPARLMALISLLLAIFLLWAWVAGVGERLLSATEASVVIETVDALFEVGREVVPVPLPTFGQVVLILALITAYPILGGFWLWYRGRGTQEDRNSAAYLLLSILFMALTAVPVQAWFRTSEIVLQDSRWFTLALLFMVIERRSERVRRLLSRLSVGQKLGWGFGSVVAVVWLLSMTSVIVLSTTNRRVETTITTQHAISMYSGDILSNVRAARVAENEALARVGRTSFSTLFIGPLSKGRQHLSLVGKQIRNLEQLPLTPQERRNVEFLNSTLALYKRDFEQFADLIMAIGDEDTGLLHDWLVANEQLEQSLRASPVTQGTLSSFFEYQKAESKFFLTHHPADLRAVRAERVQFRGWFDSIEEERLSSNTVEVIRQALETEQKAFEAYAAALQELDRMSRSLEANGTALQEVATVLSETSMNQFHAELDRTVAFQTSGGLGVTGITVLAFMVALFALQTISTQLATEAGALTETARQLAAGNLDARVQLQANDELGFVGRTLNQMAARLQELLTTLEERVARRTSQLETAALVSQEASTLVDVQHLLNHTVEVIRQRFGFYHAQVFLLDEERRWAVLRASTGEPGRLLLARGHRLEVGSRSVIGKVTAEGVPVVARDTDTDPIHRKNELLPETRSELAVPMKLGGQVIGALDVQSKHPDAFGEDDIVALQILANQIAVALRNAELFRSLQETLHVTETLYTTGQRLFEAPDEGTLLARLLEGVVEAGREPFDLVGGLVVTFTDSDPGAGHVVAAWQRDGQPSPLENATLCLGVKAEACSEWCLFLDPHSEHILNSTVEIEEGSEALQDYLKRLGAASLALLPLRVGEELAGAVLLLSARGGAFESAQLVPFRVLIDEAGTVLQNRRLLQQTEEALSQTRLLYSATSGFVQAESPEEVAAVALEAARALGFDLVNLAVLPEVLPPEPDALIGREFRVYACGTHPKMQDVEFTLQLTEEMRPIVEALVASREAVLAVEAGVETMFAAFKGPVPPEVQYEALLSRPLMTRDQITGSLAFVSVNPRSFDETTKRLFTAICDQASVALETILLFERLKTNLANTQALYNASAALLAASTVDEMAEAIAQHLLPTAEAFVAINELDVDETGEVRGFTVLANYLPGRRRSPHVGRYFTVEEFPTIRHLVAPGFPPLAVEDVERDPRMTDADRTSYRKQRVCSMFAVAFPLGRGYGMLHISFRKPTRFSQADVQRWQTITGQLGLVMENRRLLEQTRAALEETRHLYETASALVQSTEVEDVYTVLLDACRPLDPFQAGILTFDEPVPLDQRPEIIRLVRAAGRASWPFPEGAALSAHQFPLVEHLPADEPLVVSRTEELMDRPDLGDFLKRLGVRALAFYPFRTATAWLGGLLLAWDEPQRFTPEDLRPLEAAVPQATVVLENRRLFREVQAALARTQRLYRATRLLSTAATVQDVAHAIFEAAGEMWDTVAVLLFPNPVPKGEAVPEEVINMAVAPVAKQVVPTGIRIPWRKIIPAEEVQQQMLSNLVAISADDDTRLVEDSIREQLLQHLKVGRFIVAPLRTPTYHLGWFTVRADTPGSIPPEDVEIFRTLADQAAVVLDSLRLFETVQRRAWQEEMLTRIATRLYRETDPRAILELGAAQLREVLNARRALVWTPGPQRTGSGEAGRPGRGDGQDNRPSLPRDGEGDGDGRR